MHIEKLVSNGSREDFDNQGRDQNIQIIPIHAIGNMIARKERED